MFVIWSRHNNHLKGHKLGKYKPAMLKRSGKILLLSNLASSILSNNFQKLVHEKQEKADYSTFIHCGIFQTIILCVDMNVQ